MSSLEARIAKLEKVVAPDGSDKPCVTVRITRDASHLLTAGDVASVEKPRKRRASGHKCGDHCVEVSISFNPPVSKGSRGDNAEPAAVGAHPGSGRGDVQRLPESAAAGRDVEQPHSGPPRSPAPAAEPETGPVDVPAREAVVEVERTDPPALVGPLELERRQEEASVAHAFARDAQLLVPWWLPVVPSQLGPCAWPYCSHPADEHRSIQLRLQCRRCGFQADQHHPDGLSLDVPQYARRVSPCDNYMAIYIDPEESDRCEHPDCRCTGWRRWVRHDPSDPHVTFADLWAERERLIAETERELAELRARLESMQRQGVKPNDLGPSPHGCPVHVGGDSA